MAFLVISTDLLVIHIDKGTLCPGRCPECEAIVPWDDDRMICWNCGFEGGNDLFAEIEFELQRESFQ